MTSSNESNWQSWPEEDLTSSTKTTQESFSDPSVDWDTVTPKREVPAIQAKPDVPDEHRERITRLAEAIDIKKPIRSCCSAQTSNGNCRNFPTKF